MLIQELCYWASLCHSRNSGNKKVVIAKNILNKLAVIIQI